MRTILDTLALRSWRKSKHKFSIANTEATQVKFKVKKKYIKEEVRKKLKFNLSKIIDIQQLITREKTLL